MVKKVRLLITLLCLLTSNLFAQTTATESFDYVTSASLEGQGESDVNWAGPWRKLHGNELGTTNISSSALPLLPFGQQTQPNLATLQSTGGLLRYQRLFATSHLPADGAIWLSVAMACGNNALDAAGAVGLIDQGEIDFRALRFSLGKDFGQTIAVADGTALYPRSLQANLVGGGWLVAALYPTDGNQWKAYAWSNPDPTVVPDTALAVVRAMPVKARSFTGIWLQTAGGAMDSFQVDDIRIGDNYSSVTPHDWEEYIAPDIPAPREPFDYSPDTDLSGHNGGQGFGSPWRKVGGMEYQVADDNFLVTDTLETQPNLLDLNFSESNGNVRYVRQFAAPFDPSNTEYWLGANLSIAYSELGNVAQLFLAQTNSLGPSGPAGQLFQIGKAFNIAQFTLGQPGNYVRVMGRPADNEYFVVVRMRPNGPTARYDLWLNPDPTQIPPDADIRASIELPLPAGGWNGVGVKVEGNVGVRMRVDDIGLGPEYQDAVPTYWQGDPSGIVNRISGIKQLSLFPNPSRETAPQLRLHADQPLEINISIFDQLGKRVSAVTTVRTETGPQNIALPSSAWHLPPGPYRIILQTNRGLSTLPWIKND